MIDPKTEELLSMGEAAALPVLRSRAGKPSTTTLWRWCTAGSKSTAGHRVRLETIRLPGGVFTSRNAVDRFVAALNNADVPAPAQRDAQIDAAARELQAAGIV